MHHGVFHLESSICFYEFLLLGCNLCLMCYHFYLRLCKFFTNKFTTITVKPTLF